MLSPPSRMWSPTATRWSSRFAVALARPRSARSRWCRRRRRSTSTTSPGADLLAPVVAARWRVDPGVERGLRLLEQRDACRARRRAPPRPSARARPRRTTPGTVSTIWRRRASRASSRRGERGSTPRAQVREVAREASTGETFASPRSRLPRQDRRARGRRRGLHSHDLADVTSRSGHQRPALAGEAADDRAPGFGIAPTAGRSCRRRTRRGPAGREPRAATAFRR